MVKMDNVNIIDLSWVKLASKQMKAYRNDLLSDIDNAK